MNKRAIELMEYDKIREILSSYGVSQSTKEKIRELMPSVDINQIQASLRETSEARRILDLGSSIPVVSTDKIERVITRLDKEGILGGEELEAVANFLYEIYRLKKYMMDKAQLAPIISSYALSTYELADVREELEKAIVHGKVDDKATIKLSKIRKKMRICEDRIKEKLDTILKNQKSKGYIQDSVISQRNGRYVIPVKSEYKNNVDGSIHDRSGSNSTVFIEPAEVKKLQDELNILLIEEEQEVYIILSTLTNLVDEQRHQLSINVEAMLYYDFIFAKGKYSRAINGRSVELNTKNYINIKEGIHPLLLTLTAAVPLNLEIGGDYRALVITGPNTGGKTVALKTVGLLTMMAQTGLHIPVGIGSELGIFVDILTDIGDGQSIEQNLSTFSSHITNIINILSCADENSLVILDEIGAGTDPGEGMGLAVAVLDEIYNRGSVLLATTHYSEIKDFAGNKKGFVNGRMEFDVTTLKPLYELTIGKPGMSNAFLIALRLGMDKSIIEKAHQITYKESKTYEDFNRSIEKPFEETRTMAEEHAKKLKEFNKVLTNNGSSEKQQSETSFNIGDNVFIGFMNRNGIICELQNSKGEYGVMVMKKKLKINKKRLSLYIDSKEMYPEDYDFNIIFESVENRKMDKLMTKRHVEGGEIIRDK